MATSSDAATPPQGDPLREFEDDPALEPFLTDDFDAVTYASESLTARTAKTISSTTVAILILK